MTEVLFKVTPRQGIIAKPGRVIVSSDFAGQELYVAAVMSNDQIMLDSFRQPAIKKDETGNNYTNPWSDLHTITAKNCVAPHLFIDKPESQWVKIAKDSSLITRKGCARDLSKNLNFGVLYSQGSASMSVLYHVKEETAKQWIELHKQTYVGFHTWAKETADVGTARGWIETQDIYKRVRWVAEANSKGGEAVGPLSINHKIQSSSANITKLAGIYIYEYCLERPEVKFLSSCHDECVVEVPGKVTFIPEKSKIAEDGTVLSAYYEPDDECLYYFAPVVLLMERAETEILNGVLQGRAQATPAPYWAKSGLELDGNQLLESYGHLIDSKYKIGRIK